MPKPSVKTVERPVLVTTAHRGVFFGYATDTSGPTIRLTRCRNVLYWGQAVRGFLGLAVNGPDETCRVGPAAEATELRNITSVSEVSPEAIQRFEEAPWKD
jgi:hypothetical protein